MARLILNQLGKVFGTGRAAVSGFSLDVREGGFLALLGPSGCGKTTVLRMIAGFETPSDGSIHLGERLLADAAQSLPPEKRNMAMVFQSYALWPHMCVADNVGYPLKVRGISGEAYQAKVRDALGTVRLADYAERRPAELSGGQRQRVALARCLVTSPDVVLLDEPLANLDRHLKQEMEETFREFHQRSGATMIYVTHDQSEAMALATDVAVMSEGRLLQVAAPAEIYARPEGRIVGGLIGRGAILTLSVMGGERQLEWDELQDALQVTNIDGTDILVRPEDVIIGGEGAPATVESALFEGERYAAKLTLGNGQTLRAFSRVPVVPGEVVHIVIRAGWRL
ncbi:ABC transporter ATP-binding protein [Rhizobium laguerreae]|uniref:ABC transporter ATP-binding protein n=1 Tax=Rhizobium laguerreae TaxID=1076926 RepID=UPI001442903C|nr:ABC transporter ATP-binding protein [Rhizobium laguerreae]MBY3274572.1 ABC transporter ATP-binding protein [Rhizobium laguerreae]NKM30983.1 ATP-binding cassette domain-containing protein [Rhizobium laguerreae]NKM39795.1 ATP-binding cassette domain-containing protein [Rhizobium laguerreae]